MKLIVLPILLAISLSCDAAPKYCKTIKIAIIDTGLDLKDPRFKDHICKSGHMNFVQNEGIEDAHSHGTHVAGLIQKYAGEANYCFLIYKYFREETPGFINLDREILALQAAIKNKADIVNFSGGGSEFNEEEALVIANNPQVQFVVAAGNDHLNLDEPPNTFFPASLFYKNIFVVGSLDKNGNRSRTSNYSEKIKNWELGDNVLSTTPNNRNGYMSGTSQATAIFSGKLVAKMVKECDDRRDNGSQ